VTGAILIGASSKTGSLAVQLTGAVTLGASSMVTGNISTATGAVLVGAFSSISGAISSSIEGAVGLGEQVIVGGNISTLTGAIDVGASSTLNGSLDVLGVGAISLGATLHVVGTVTTTAGAITIGAFSLADSEIATRGAGAITMGNQAIVAGVCCRVTNSAICVTNNTTLPLPPVCAAGGGGAATPDAFACLAAGSNSPWSGSARQALFTKLTGVPFALGIAALKTNGELEANYVKSPGLAKYARVELFDASAPAPSCAAYGGALATRIATFTESSAGRTLAGDFNLGGAYQNVLCRVSECTDAICSGYTGVQSCSEDRFSVRPAALVVAQNTPTKNAGSTFTLQATAVKLDLGTVANYTGMPTLNVDQISGTPAFTAAALAPQALPVATAGVSSSAFTYDEVGSFTLPANSPGSFGIVDSSYTNIDAVNIAGSIDCIAGSASNVLDGSGRVGCLIGQLSALTVGRFFPDHFEIVPTFAPACSSGGFSYMDQPFTFSYTVTAKSLPRLSPNPPGNRALSLYNGGQLNLVVADGTANLNDLTARLAPAVPRASSWSLGSHALMPASYQFTRPTSATANATWGPYDGLDIGVAIDDPDGRGYLAETPSFALAIPAACIATGSAECRNYASLSAGAKTRMRLGRLKLDNAYGSALLPLAVPLAAQYWTGIGWARNALDSCTVLPISSIAMGNYSKQLNACETRLMPVGSVAILKGRLLGLRLSSPGVSNAGSVDLAINIGDTVTANTVGNNTCINPDGSVSAATAAGKKWFGARPTARATFGIYKSPLIYRREIY
jgi:MSHA biogenesis protein MshQ